MILLKRKNTTRRICTAALIAALYVGLTYLSSLFGLSGGVLQLRLSEALCVLPAFTPYAIPGLFFGCIISNLLMGGILLDVIFGSVATLIGAFGTYIIGKKSSALATFPPIVSNTVIIPFVLVYAYGAEEALWVLFVSIGVGECISAGVAGGLLYRAVERIRFIFK